MFEDELNERKKLILDLVNDKNYNPMKFKEIAGFLQVPKENRNDLKLVLDKLMSEGELTVDNRGCYFKGDSRLKTGIFMGTSKGFGFVRIEGLSDDIFIPESMTKGAFDKDQVQVLINEPAAKASQSRRKEGEIINILSRNTKEVVGTYQKNKSFGFVIPDNQKFGSDIFIEEKNSQGAVSGHKVIVELTSFGSSKKNPEGKVIEIIGHINDPGVDIMSIILANGIPTEFPPEVMNQIKGIGNDPSPSDFSGRKDLRDVYMVTIDGEDAKDLDDAVSLSMEGDIYKLGVHIADVSHYVTENSYLDKEAINRGTSVYLVDRVIPMLPHKLSNGICSLNAGTDRLALSCIMDIDKKGNVIGHEIAETVINVNHRMTYTLVKNILEEKSVQAMPKDEAETAKYSESVPMFVLMEELAQILREKRKKRGSIDFDLPESKIKLNEEGFPESIQPYERNVATKIIEDFMLIANETVAEDFFWQELPFVYRTHETPDPEKIQKLGIFINNFGYTIHFNQDEIHPMEISKLLAKVESKPEEALISRLTLRSMKQARYTDTCEGHFGLAAKYYCHFTSPIRRYPDLQIHRIIKEHLRGGIKQNRIAHYGAILPEVAKQSSIMERRAEEAEREVTKLKKVEYMSQFIGETFEGVISSVTSWGMYVELSNTVEGMVRVADLLDDYYIFDEQRYMFIGEHTKRTYKLGQKIEVVVVKTDKLLRTIDFLPVEHWKMIKI